MIKNKIQQQIYFKIFLIFTLLNTLQAQEKHVNSPKLFIQGNHNYSELKIQSIIKEEWEQYVKTRKLHFIDDAVYILQNHYKNNGYSFVLVDYEYEQDITIYVQEYYPVVIQKITIQSATEQTLSMPITELYSLLTPKPMTTPHYLKQEILEQDITNIKNYYKNRSFLDVRVQLLIQYKPEPPESQRADVQINIYEGAKHFLTNLSFQGNASFPAEELLQEKMPKPYIPSMIQEYVRKIKSHYKNNAFAKIEIKTNVTQKEDNHQIHKTIHFVIKENRKYTIKNIQIKGNQKVNTSYIQTKLEILENQLYNAQKIQQTKKNLFNTGLFLNVDIQEQYIEQEQNIKEGTTNLIILVQERPDNTVNLSLGYDTSYGVTAGIEYEILSILGTGLKTILSLDGTIVSSNLTKRQAKIEFVEPEFLESSTWSATYQIHGLMEENPTYDSIELGGALLFTKKFNTIYSLQLGYEFTWTDISDIQDNTVDTEEGTTIFSVLSQKLFVNYRDDNAYPTRGSYHTLEFNESLTAICSDVDYFKIHAQTSYYFHLGHQIVLALSLQAGAIIPFNNSDNIPIQRRYFSGGATTIRSFKEKQLPPLNDQHKPIGGEAIFLFSTELRIPIYNSFGISPFYDTGQIFQRFRRFKDYRINKLRHALGLSLWYQTPIGPIRLDFGFNPDKQKHEKLFAWFISIGFSF